MRLVKEYIIHDFLDTFIVYDRSIITCYKYDP